ncbi:uncharacterized protein [Drosophila bipectinata]|uniref:uncharacterized protein n=1 Tax=Drosophila bipectinata TaxID=42026 RepID=UPI001C89FF20|nr:uncharacterized protein LOC108131892 [Drosophila bipectinata]
MEQKDHPGPDKEVKEAHPEEEFGSEEHATAKYLADTFGGAKIYVEAGRDEAYVQLKEPQLHRFKLSEQTHNPPPGYDEDAFQPAEAQDIERWGQAEVLKVDLVEKKDEEQFGKMQRDATTGEKYILLPINVEFLIDPANMSLETAKEYLNSCAQFKEILLSPEEDHQMTRHTVHITNIPLEPEQAPGMDGESGEEPQVSKKEPVDNQSEETLRGSEDGNYWDFHMHQYYVPRFNIPFELNFATAEEMSRAGQVAGGDTDRKTPAEPVVDTNESDV